MLVEIHMLQNFAPSNLNRDDTNSPKDCTFGGFRRARVSSQCLKRAIRTDAGFRKAVEEKVGVRTKLVHERLAALLAAKGRSEEQATPRVQRALEAVGFKWDDTHTAVLLFVDDGELEAWAEVLDKHWDSLGESSPEAQAQAGDKPAKRKSAKEKKQAAAEQVPTEVRKALRDVMGSTSLRGVDIALFGRMVAEHTDMSVDAACQVAHAISTHAVNLEMDFFTAVDDLQPKADTGAGMMGVIEFNSACFYRYALVDFNQLEQNLAGSGSAVAKAGVLGFCQSAVRAIPTGKQNGFAAQNPPDWVRVEVRRGSPRSLVNAFADPVRVNERDSDLVGQSIQRAQDYALRVDAMLDNNDILFVGTATTRPDLCEGATTLSELWAQLERALGRDPS